MRWSLAADGVEDSSAASTDAAADVSHPGEAERRIAEHAVRITHAGWRLRRWRGMVSALPRVTGEEEIGGDGRRGNMYQWHQPTAVTEYRLASLPPAADASRRAEVAAVDIPFHSAVKVTASADVGHEGHVHHAEPGLPWPVSASRPEEGIIFRRAARFITTTDEMRGSVQRRRTLTGCLTTTDAGEIMSVKAVNSLISSEIAIRRKGRVRRVPSAGRSRRARVPSSGRRWATVSQSNCIHPLPHLAGRSNLRACNT